MSTFLLLIILVGMLGVAVMIIYVIDKIHSIEKHARRAPGAADNQNCLAKPKTGSPPKAAASLPE